MNKYQFAYLNETIIELESSIAAKDKELEKAKAHELEILAENDAMAFKLNMSVARIAELEKALSSVSHWASQKNNNPIAMLSRCYSLATEALSPTPETKEILYNGFCPHGVPFGQCKESHASKEAGR